MASTAIVADVTAAASSAPAGSSGGGLVPAKCVSLVGVLRQDPSDCRFQRMRADADLDITNYDGGDLRDPQSCLDAEDQQGTVSTPEPASATGRGEESGDVVVGQEGGVCPCRFIGMSSCRKCSASDPHSSCTTIRGPGHRHADTLDQGSGRAG